MERRKFLMGAAAVAAAGFGGPARLSAQMSRQAALDRISIERARTLELFDYPTDDRRHLRPSARSAS